MLIKCTVEHEYRGKAKKSVTRLFNMRYDDNACEFVDSLMDFVEKLLKELFTGDFPNYGKIVFNTTVTDDISGARKNYRIDYSSNLLTKIHKKAVQDLGKFGYNPTVFEHISTFIIFRFLMNFLSPVYNKTIKEFEKIDLSSR